MDKTASSVLSTTELIVSIAMVIIVLMLISYCISRLMSLPDVQLPDHHDHHRPNIDSSSDDDRQNIVENSTVIDDEALERFPKLIYSQLEKRKIFGNEYLGNSTSSCSVCLADYKESDVLRMLPHCGHVFHLNCVDSWLRLRPTCPLCRSSPDIAVASTTPDHGEHDQRQKIGRNGAVSGGSVPTDVVAVDEAVLQRFPKLLYSEAKLQINEGSCSVCLGDYEENDVLRLLPHCGHAFHLECVDPWLRLRPTCPLCRSSPHVVAGSRDELDL